MVIKYIDSYFICNLFFLIIFLFSIFFNSFQEGFKKNYLLFIILVVFIFFASTRYGIGKDYFEYIRDFKLRRNNKISEDYFFTLISRFSWFLDKSNFTFFLITSVITNSLFIFFLKKTSHLFFFSLFLYVSLWYYFMSWNLVRQYLAISFLLHFVTYVNDKRYLKSLIFFILCLFTHVSSIGPLLFVIYINLLKGFKSYFWFLIIPLFIIFYFYDFLISNFSLNGIKFSHYVFLSSKVNFTPFYLSIIALLPLLYLRFINKLKSPKVDYYLKIVILGSIFLLFSTKSIYFTRIAFYFLVFQLVLIPNCIAQLKNKLYYYSFIFFYIFYSLISFNLSFNQNRDGVIPFHFISIF